MLLTKDVEIILKAKDRKIKYFRDKGYFIEQTFDAYGRKCNFDEYKLVVRVEDLPPTCRTIFVEVLCDYCLEEGIENIKKISILNYNSTKKDIVNKDCCIKHASKKGREIERGIASKDITLEYVKEQYLELYYKIGKIPSTKDVWDEHRINKKFPTWGNIAKYFGSIHNLKKELFDFDKKNKIISDLKNYINKNGLPRWDDFKLENGFEGV
jgi:hypothetical protein